MRLGLVILLCVASARAEPDATRTWKSECRWLAGQEKKFWRSYQERFNQGRILMNAEIDKAWAQPDQHKEATYDYSEFSKLYEDYDVMQTALGEADLQYATSGSPKALPDLFKELLSVVKEIDALEKKLLNAKPKMAVRLFHQQPGIERQGLDVRRTGLVAAVAKCPGATDFLAGAGLKRATTNDGRKSIGRRVAVLDALALCGGPEAQAALEPWLKAKETSLRIAAVEGLIRFGAPARPALAPLLADKSPIVRRALLQEIVRVGGKDAGWIGPLVGALPQARGVEGALCVRALTALTKQPFGHAPEEWKKWFEEYKKEIEGGTFDRNNIEIQEAEPAPPAEAVAFYGIETQSKGFLIIIEGSGRLAVPADWEVQRTRFRIQWPGLRRSWEKEHPSHQTILKRELTKTLQACSADTRFGLIGLYGSWAIDTLGEKKLAAPTRKDIKAAQKFVDKLTATGWCAQYEGFLWAARMAGMATEETDADFPKPRADTVFLFDSGDPRGGRYMAPQPVVNAFKRYNRFRRLIVNTIRICNEKEASEILMKGIAEASGGTYVWMKQPPQESEQ
ncbi:MAG: HEAT repeat domain-containing protein [Planctomycetota bacterium]